MPEPITYTPPSNTQQGAYASVAIAGAAIIAWGLREFAGVEMPVEVVGALGAVLGWAAGKWGT